MKILAAYIFYVKIVKIWYMRWRYRDRGITFMSIIPTPLIGDIGEFVKRIKAQPDVSHVT